MSSTALFRILLTFGIFFLLDLYVFTGFIAAFAAGRSRIIAAWLYWGVTISFYALAIYAISTFSRATGPATPLAKWLIGSFVFLYVPKLVMLFFFAGEDAYRLLRAGGVGVAKIFGGAKEATFIESRRMFIARMAAYTAAIPAIGILYGIVKGRFNFTVRKTEIAFKDLPEAFDGLTITQISDLHVGSFDTESDRAELNHAIALINKQKSDLIFFTGDLVNNRAEEMQPWMDDFGKLHAPMGKYSILGNHDYGDYSDWPSREAKRANMQQLYNTHDQLGFTLLRNQNVRIEKNGQHLELLGMENWGKGFAQYGDFSKTLQGTNDGAFKILLSHDPSHWEEEVMSHDTHVHLTLSGHTHGAQFGIEVPGFKFSPVQLRYKRWAGLYSENSRYLYVNRGLGFLAFPGRVGIWPEITVITLRKA
ncbi:MAG TPA: metallophosphoesterase [Bacteroidia bacterium]|jgi:predicted MPP superfamily phosphohydrolase